MEIPLIKALLHIELRHAGKVITVHEEAVVIILQVVAVVFPIDASFVSCQTPISVAFQWTFTWLTFCDIVVHPSFLRGTRRLPGVAPRAESGLRQLVGGPSL